MNKINFSIVIPSYNRKNYLKKAIESVLNQSYEYYEIIVIDNNSIDGSQGYIKSLKRKNIILIITDNFGSIAKSRNIGIENSKGNWISFLDSDDFWHSKKLENVKDKIFKESPDIVSHDTYIINNKDEVCSYRKCGTNKKKILKELISKRNLYGTSAISIRKSFLRKHNLFFDESLNIATSEDYDFWTRLIIKKAKVSNIKKGLGFYKIHDNNASKNNLKQYQAALSVKNKNLKYIIEKDIYKFQDLLEMIFFYNIFYLYVKIKKINHLIPKN